MPECLKSVAMRSLLGLFQLFWEKAPGLNWEKYATFWEFFISVILLKKRLKRA